MVEITLLVYSGRENPRWTLSDAQAEELDRRLAGVPAADAQTADALGYAGFSIGRPGQPPLRVPACSQPELERWLLATASTALDDALRAHVTHQLPSLPLSDTS